LFLLVAGWLAGLEWQGYPYRIGQRMNWEALGAVGELIGAAGVILTLVYLAHQIRQNTRAIRAQTHQAITSANLGMAMSMAESEGLAEVLVRGLADFDSLDPPDRLRTVGWFNSFLKFGENTHYQFLQGGLEKAVWEGWMVILENWVTQPGPREYWKERRSAFQPAFRGLVDGMLSEQPTPLFGLSFEGTDPAQSNS
jgi:hypothetical protein